MSVSIPSAAAMVMALTRRMDSVIFMALSFRVAGERSSVRGRSLAGRCAKGHWPFSVLVWANAPPRTVFSCWAVSCLVGAALVGLRPCLADRSPRLRRSWSAVVGGIRAPGLSGSTSVQRPCDGRPRAALCVTRA